MKTKLEQFLNVLFEPDEFIWFGGCYKSNKLSKPQSDLPKLNQSAPTTDGYFICLNPANQLNAKHGKESISIYRNLLIECDNMSLQQQESFLKRKKLPFSTLTYSGGKSLHAVISMERPFETEAEYKKAHDRITFALTELNDPQTDKVSIFTRLPDFLRQTDAGIRKQASIEIGRRISHADLEVFLAPTNKEYFESKSMVECARAESRNYSEEYDESENNNTKRSTHEILESYVERHDFKKTAYDQYQLRCPICASHGGDSTSEHLSINPSKELWHCFAGCDGRELYKIFKKSNTEKG